MITIEINNVYQEDCIDGIEKIIKSKIEVDLTITSPPYNLGINYDGYNDDLPIDKYINTMQNVCNKLFLATKIGGRVCFNVPPDIGTLKNNDKISLDVLFHNCLEKAGFKYRTKIVWNKNQITSRTAWGSWKSPSNPNILPPFEYILVFYKDNPKHNGDKDKIDIERDEFIEWTNGLWSIAAESKKKIGHPAPYPEELCYRLIKMFSYKNDLIFDPFSGSGTTCVVAKKLHRNYLAFDISDKYVKMSLERIQSIV